MLSPSRQSLLSSNSQFHRLSQRGLLGGRATTNTPRKGSKKNFQKFVAFMGKSCFISRRDKKESVDFFDSLDRLCEWISSEDGSDSEEDIEEAA